MIEKIQAAPEVNPFSKLSSGRQHTSKTRAVLLVLAIIFAATTVVYSFAWMYYIRWQTRVELGIEIKDVPQAIEITEVHPNSPAQQAGLSAHDLIVAINGQDMSTADPTFIRATW